MVSSSMQGKDNISYIQIFGKRLPAEGRKATVIEETKIKQWIRMSSKIASYSFDEKDCFEEGWIKIHLLSYPIKDSPMVIRAIGEGFCQLTDAVGEKHILDQPDLRKYLEELSS